MPAAQEAEILRVHISESDRYHGQPLYEAIIARCRETGIAGATVFRGIEGFGESAGMHRGGLLHSDRPIVVTIVDTVENIRRLIPVLSDLIDTGMMATSRVQMIRVTGGPGSRPDAGA